VRSLLIEIAEVEWNCGIATDAPEKHAIGDRLIPRSVTMLMLRHGNGRVRHATIHKRPRCHHPGSRSGHGGERTGFQFEPGVTLARANRWNSTAATINSSRDPSQSTRSQCFGRPNTCAVAGTSAAANHQRTGVAYAPTPPATRARSSADARRGSFRFPIPDGSFRFPVPDESLRFPIPDRFLALTIFARRRTSEPAASENLPNIFEILATSPGVLRSLRRVSQNSSCPSRFAVDVHECRTLDAVATLPLDGSGTSSADCCDMCLKWSAAHRTCLFRCDEITQHSRCCFYSGCLHVC
jgi:hypothetical protein